MKLMIKLLLLILVIGLAAPFFLKRPDGQPWLNAEDLLPDFQRLTLQLKSGWQSLRREVREVVGSEHSDQTRVYRWRAADGSWQFSDTLPVREELEEKPSETLEVETIWVDPNTNLIQGLPTVPDVAETDETAGEPASVEGPVATTLSPQKIETLIEDAKNVQGLLNQRSETLDSL